MSAVDLLVSGVPPVGRMDHSSGGPLPGDAPQTCVAWQNVRP